MSRPAIRTWNRADAHPRLKFARPRAQLRQGRNDWYSIKNLGTGTAEIAIYDEIGYWGISAQDFIRDLREINASEIVLRVNSPGGEIFDGIAIFNCLKSHAATVTTYVDSIAASIASVIALAGDRVVMQPHSQMMIHDGSGLAIGNAADMREMAELLDRQSDNIAGVYASKAGGTVAEWRERMTAETWYNAAEAVAAGLADEVAGGGDEGDDEPVDEGTWDLSIFQFAGRAAAPAPRNQADEPAPVEPAPVIEPEPATEPVPVEPAVVEPEPAPVVEPEPQPEPEPEPEITDEWAAEIAHLEADSPASDPDDEFARLTEAL